LILLVNTVLCTTEQCRILWSFKVVWINSYVLNKW
jgi:hypothetical protein